MTDPHTGAARYKALWLKMTVCATSLCLMTTASVRAQQAEEALDLGTIVLGNLIEQAWLETGTSINVLGEAEIEERPGINGTRDVLEQSVNVLMPTATAKAATVRGVDGTGPAENANAFFAGSRARLGLRVDGRTAGYNELVFGNARLWDVNRVEVLRGPQSTLIGRNAIAGTAVVSTNDPVFVREGAVRVSGGNHDGRGLSLMWNQPINDDQLALRFSADWQRSQSSVHYEPFQGVDNPGERKALTLRAKLLAQPNIGQSSTLKFTLSHSDNREPNAERIVRPFRDRRSNFPNQPVHQTKTTGLSMEFEVQISDALRFELDSSLSKSTFDRITAPVPSSTARIDKREFSIDPRLHYTAANGIQALIGAHLYISDQSETIQFMQPQAFEDDRRAVAVYGEVKVPLSQTFDLTFGARYERETHKRCGGDAGGAIAEIDLDRKFEDFLPRIGLNWQPKETQSYGLVLSKGYNAGGGGISFGFPNPFPIVQYQYDSETVHTVEIYGRQELMDGRLSLTQNLFYSRYNDMQLPFDLTPNDALDESFVVRNADEVVTYGAEFGAKYAYSEQLDLYGSLGLLKTDIVSFPGSGVEGNELFGAPAISANLGFNWSYNGWNIGASARHNGSYYTGINNRARGKVDPHWVVDARIAYEQNGIALFAEVENLFDDDTAIARYPGASAAADTAVLQQPRTVRFGLTSRF